VGELLRQEQGRKAYLLVLHDHRKLDYLVPLERLPVSVPQVKSLPVPQQVPFLFEPRADGEPAQKYYDL
ncbi:MAG TPA: hypothetical protein VGP93_05180, partial [Polyangiaceae bacterium]|nr:hypothetical protein [Polyangiaceae bacterium]